MLCLEGIDLILQLVWGTSILRSSEYILLWRGLHVLHVCAETMVVKRAAAAEYDILIMADMCVCDELMYGV